MASFYGNVKYNQQNPFTFDKIYPNRKAMDDAVKDGTDGIFINRYVLINYLMKIDEATEAISFEERYQSSGTNNPTILESSTFASNRSIDLEEYAPGAQAKNAAVGGDYHLTVWMKIYVDNAEKYIQVGDLKADAPNFEVFSDAPSRAARIDLVDSSELDYKVYLPQPWKMAMENGDFNQAGFDKALRNRVDNVNDSVSLEEISSGIKYPRTFYYPVTLVANTYLPNRYYTKSGSHYYLATATYSASTTYYALSSVTRINATSVGRPTTATNDTKNIKLTFPSVGNAISDVYDALYGLPNPDKLLGYTTTAISTSSTKYANSTSGDNNIPVKLLTADGTSKYISTTEQGALSHIHQEPYLVPVYSTTSNRRPYTEAGLFNSIDIEPYNNIDDADISVGWTLEELKKYISELRYLAKGGEDGGGLQADWTLNTPNALGYINNRPWVIDTNAMTAIWGQVAAL